MRHARARRLIPEKPRAAIDATGYETRHVSRYFAWRSGRRKQRAWPNQRREILMRVLTHNLMLLAAA